MSETDGSRALPIQLETLETAREVAVRAEDVNRSAAEIAATITNVKAVSSSLRCSMESGAGYLDLKSILDSESMGHRLSICADALAKEGIAGLIKTVVRYIDTFISVLYPERVYVWSEAQLETAKAETKFASSAIKAIGRGTTAVSAKLADLYSYLSMLDDLLEDATYRGQAMELQVRISAAQLELVAQQAEVLRRFDEQDKQMAQMNDLVSWCTIAATVIAFVQAAPLVCKGIRLITMTFFGFLTGL